MLIALAQQVAGYCSVCVVWFVGGIPPTELLTDVLLRLWYTDGLLLETFAAHSVSTHVAEEVTTENRGLTYVTELPGLVHVILPGRKLLIRDLREFSI